MKKKLGILVGCLVLVLLGASISFASLHGVYKGYPIVKVVVDGKEIKGDVPAISFNGRTMVPVRFVSDALGANVSYDAKTETVIINTKGSSGTSGSGNTDSSNVTTSKNEVIVKDAYGNPVYSLKINKITESKDRNEYSDKKPAQVIIIDYTYKNLNSDKDVFISELNFKVVDSKGKIGYTYPLIRTRYPESVPKGVTCDAQAIFGLDNKSSTVKLLFYDNIFDSSATASFELPVY